jgi:hypothetical protein
MTFEIPRIVGFSIMAFCHDGRREEGGGRMEQGKKARRKE